MSQSGDKTERATPKKRRDAREKGQVLKSTEVSTAVSVLGMFALLQLLSGFIAQRAASLVTTCLSPGFAASLSDLEYQNIFPTLLKVLADAGMILAPLLLAAMLMGVITNLMQVGFMFLPKLAIPKFSRINPAQGFKRIFSSRSLVELVKSILKVVIIGYIVYDEYINHISFFPGMMTMPILTAASRLMDILFTIGLKAGMALLIIAAADFMYQWWRHEKDLRMSKQEIKDEYKMTEGDPKIKSKIRQKQREMGMMRMMSAVPQADVVITNPTHYAVAIQYKEDSMSAPLVLAKGKDLIAMRIKERAKECDIQIIENRPVAQALYAHCEVGDPIPEAMYQAVAEILALVYRARAAAAGGIV